MQNAYLPFLKEKLELNSKKVELERCKKISSVFIFFFLHLKPDFRYSSVCFNRLSRDRSMDKLAITDKISIKLEFNSSLFLKYGRIYPTFNKANSTILARLVVVLTNPKLVLDCLFVPSLSSCHEKATEALYFGRIRTRLRVVHFRVFRLFFWLLTT